MNTNTAFHSMDSTKRPFSIYQAETTTTTTTTSMTQEAGNSETNPCSIRAADRTVKRSRRHSPVPDLAKAFVRAVTEVDLPPLPTIMKDVVLPDPKESKVEPDEYLLQLAKAQFGVSLKVQNGLELGEDYFKPITDEQHAAYTMAVLTPARDNDVKALKELVDKNGRQTVDCVNRFGESLLNLACRRGFTDVAEFLLSTEIGLEVRTKDDFGRTALHDAMWNPTPQLDVCRWLIERDPSLLLVTDKRGNTPFMYARAEDYPTWRQFLFDNRQSLQGLTATSTLERFC